MINIVVEYVWIDGTGKNTRSKMRTIKHKETQTFKLSNVPDWNFDGSSTGQAVGNNSEVIIVPRALYKNPLAQSPAHYIVMCDCYDGDMIAHPSNKRVKADLVFEVFGNEKAWYGLEQEYFLVDPTTMRPLGWPRTGEPEKSQGEYYCGIGPDNVFGREIVETHYKACLEAGLDISGINGEVAPGQWEFQIGPVEGIAAADQLWIARFLLNRIAEYHGVIVSYDPKLEKDGDWNGSGLHTNFSTLAMRQRTNGLTHIINAMPKLSKTHLEHLKVYGDNEYRLTGLHETSSPDVFSYGVADRTASVRIPRQVNIDGYGYLEDRRPASDADPYEVTAIILNTICS